ncbi:hypothetical protein DPEC_G00093940 [Dallia pectoralis]|uniref:Uncharacterized protein n=1 Tax=Dallia pectoralis TaxID=75939 RepID=A0ACC2H0U4_DALPE|nr:hypothetical protein DPEC_G00093940 [Dallia pectoralis]
MASASGYYNDVLQITLFMRNCNDDFKECDICDFTSSTETEEGALAAKRRWINKTFEDCVTDESGHSEVEFDQEELCRHLIENCRHLNSDEEQELPAAPRKLKHVQERESPVRSEYATSPSSSSPSRRSSSATTVIPTSTPSRQSSSGSTVIPQITRAKKGSLVQQSTQGTSSRQQTPSTKGKRCPYPMPEEKFQRKVMEMLVDMREDIRSLKKRDAEQCEAAKIQQASTVEALNLLDRSLDSLEEKQKLTNGLSKVGGVHLKDNVKRVMEKLMTNGLMAKFNMKGGKGMLAFTKLRLFTVVAESVQRTTAETEASISSAVAFCLKPQTGWAEVEGNRMYMKYSACQFLRPWLRSVNKEALNSLSAFASHSLLS